MIVKKGEVFNHDLMKVKVNNIELNLDTVGEVEEICESIIKVYEHKKYRITINGVNVDEYDNYERDNESGYKIYVKSDGQLVNIIDGYILLLKKLIGLTKDFADAFYLNSNPKIWTEIVKYIKLMENYFLLYKIVVKMDFITEESTGLISDANVKIESLNKSLAMLMQSLSVKNTVKIADILMWEIKTNFESTLKLMEKLGGHNANQ